jgi:undecaprenyl-diphosphatase
LEAFVAAETCENEDGHCGAVAVGFIVSFVVAIVVVRAFVGYISKHGFAPFAWYRIAAGIVALAWLTMR